MGWRIGARLVCVLVEVIDSPCSLPGGWCLWCCLRFKESSWDRRPHLFRLPSLSTDHVCHQLCISHVRPVSPGIQPFSVSRHGGHHPIPRPTVSPSNHRYALVLDKPAQPSPATLVSTSHQTPQSQAVRDAHLASAIRAPCFRGSVHSSARSPLPRRALGALATRPARRVRARTHKSVFIHPKAQAPTSHD